MKKENIEQFYGKKYNSLTVLKEAIGNGAKRRVEVVCDCGTKKIIVWDRVKTGKIKNCSKPEFHPRPSQKGRILNLPRVIIRRHSLYTTWKGIRQRCYDINADNYKYYGAKGVKMSESWLSYENFYFDNIDRYIEGFELDRYPNKTGDYELNNTRFALHVDNSRNMTSVKLSQEIANAIRESKESLGILAKRYNVSRCLINHVRKNRTWKT